MRTAIILGAVAFFGIAQFIYSRRQERIMTQAFDNLTAAVNANTDATNKAVAALGSAGTPDSAIDQITTVVNANTAALVAATPAAPAPAPLA